MIKNQSKTNKESDSWSYPSLAESWREDFVKLIPRSKRRRELIEYVDLVDWERIGHLLSSEAKAIMKKIGIPEIGDPLKLNSSIVEGIILANIKERLHYLFLHYLSSINKTDTKLVKNKKIKRILGRVEFEIIRNRSVFNTILDVGSLKWIKDSDTLQKKFDEVQKNLSKYRGQSYHKKNLLRYGEILKKNDEYKKKYGKDNYRRATYNVTKYSGANLDNFYKALDNFMNGTGIGTYKQFKDSIYYGIVEEYKKSINNARLDK